MKGSGKTKLENGKHGSYSLGDREFPTAGLETVDIAFAKDTHFEHVLSRNCLPCFRPWSLTANTDEPQ